MKYEIGNIVALANGKTVYITAVDEKQKKYTGFDTEENDPADFITFTESSVVMIV